MYVMTDAERDDLVTRFEAITTSPYANYPSFQKAVRQIVGQHGVPKTLLDIQTSFHKSGQKPSSRVYFVRNCPIDMVIPDLDPQAPVQDKYRRKTTFVGEAFLELFAQLCETPLLAYTTRNNGDFFQDVYPAAVYYGTQTQKTDGELYYHNDRTAHVVRADYLALLGLRSCPDNLIYTGYIDGAEIYGRLTQAQRDILSKPLFQTPFDQYSRDSNAGQVDSEPHAILEGKSEIRYYDTRTKPVDHASTEALRAFIAFRDALTLCPKQRQRIGVGDLLFFPNKGGLHNRDVIEVANSDAARKRWLLKTYNFASMETMHKYNMAYDGVDGLVVDNRNTQSSRQTPHASHVAP